MKIKDLPKSDRPREKLVAKGAENLKDSELLAILLRTGKAGKSDLDTLRRLPEQMNMYNSVFDKVTLIVGSTHLISAFREIPEWWGVETARVYVVIDTDS